MLGKFKEFALFLRDVVNSRKMIFALSINDFKSRYIGSYFGIIWAFVQPIVSILVFWFVFQVGFKSAPVQNYPFILWLICGMIPWFFYSDGLSNATYSLLEYSFLVKKVVFRVSILPIMKIVSALYVHLFFIIMLFTTFSLYGYFPTYYSLQVLYYSFSIVVLLLGLSWITSSLTVFMKDITQIVSILLQLGFWITPIFWSSNAIPKNYNWLIRFNPMNYIVQGYRDAFIDRIWFWSRLNETLYFWIITLFIFVLGALVFRASRQHFADLL